MAKMELLELPKIVEAEPVVADEAEDGAPAMDVAEDDFAAAQEDGAEDREDNNGQQASQNKQREPKIPRPRFDEVVEQKNAFQQESKTLREEVRKLQWQIEQRDLAIQRLMTLDDAKGQKEDEEDDEVLDTALEKKVNERLSRFEQQAIASAVENELATASEPDIANARAWYVAANAASLLDRAEALGVQISKEDALRQAVVATDQELQTIYAANPRRGVVTKYLYSQAKKNGYNAKKSASSEKMDMAAMNKLREQAGGTPAQKASVRTGPAIKDWKQQLKEKNKLAGISDALLKKWGF